MTMFGGNCDLNGCVCCLVSGMLSVGCWRYLEAVWGLLEVLGVTRGEASPVADSNISFV